MLIDCFIIEKGFIRGRQHISEDKYDESIHVKFDEELPHQGLILPKWDGEKWTEGCGEEYLQKYIIHRKNLICNRIRKNVNRICLSIASELEQSNWINFPEDYEPEEIEEKKNQIREIRAKGKEIREKISATQSLEELSELDLNIIPLPEPEEVEGE